MNATTKFRGHLCALFCVIVWGITFIVSAKLLVVFTPIQTMLLRFILAYLVLWVLHPKWYFRWQDEVAFCSCPSFPTPSISWRRTPPSPTPSPPMSAS